MGIQDFFSGIIAPGSNPADPTSPDSILRRRKIAEALLKQGTDYSPVQSPWQGAARVANALYGGLEDRMADQQEKSNNDYWTKQMGGVIGGGSAQPSVAGALADTGGQGGALSQDYFTKLAGKESGGNPNAVSPAGARGTYQFMPGTWRGVMEKHPEAGLTLDGISDPQQQNAAVRLLTQDNAQGLQAKGLPVNASTVALAHQQGLGGASALLSNPDANVVDALAGAYGGNRATAAKAVTGNGGKTDMTAGQFAQKVMGYYGMGGGMVGLGQAGGPAQPAVGPSQEQLLAIIANPNAPAGVKQVAMLKYQQMQKDPLTEVTLAEKRANIAKTAQDMQGGSALDQESKRASTEKTRAETANMGNTTDQKDYDRAVKGGYTGDYNSWLLNIKKAGAPSTNIDLKAQSAEEQAKGQGLGKRLNDVAEEGTKAQDDAMVFGRFGQLLDGVQTGKKAQVLETVRQLTGVALDPNTDSVQALQSAINYLAPRLRVAGSGSQSDTELRNFMQSIPSLINTPGGNQKILQTLQGFVEFKQRRAEIAQAWQTGEISGKEATQRIQQLQSPFSPPVKIDQSMTPDDVKKKYPSGTRIMLPDGTEGRVP